MKYFILNTKGSKNDTGPSIFYDAASGLKVVTNDPEKAVAYEGVITKKIASALKNGHITEVDAPKGAVKTKGAAGKGKAAADTKPDATKPKELSEMTDEELVEFYKENYDVSDKDLEVFSKMSTEEKAAFLKED